MRKVWPPVRLPDDSLFYLVTHHHHDVRRIEYSLGEMVVEAGTEGFESDGMVRDFGDASGAVFVPFFRNHRRFSEGDLLALVPRHRK